MLKRCILMVLCLILVGCGNETINTTSNNTQHDVDIKGKVMSAEVLPMCNEDFIVNYHSFQVKEDTDYLDVVKALGYPNDHEVFNDGFISSGGGWRRWNLSYPTHEEPEIRMIVMSRDEEDYIVGIYLELFKTTRGLQVGDSVERVLELYGRPERFEPSKATEGKLYEMIYVHDNMHIDVTLNEDMSKVQYLFIDYNMDRSVSDQGLEDD